RQQRGRAGRGPDRRCGPAGGGRPERRGVRRPGDLRRRVPDGHDDLRRAAGGRGRGLVAHHRPRRPRGRRPARAPSRRARRRALGWRTPGAHHETGCTMRNKVKATAAATMVRLLQNARYEVLPTASIEETVLAHVGTDLTLTVTASPGKGLEATLDL